MRTIFTTLILFIFQITFAQTWQQKVDPELLDKFEGGGQIETILIFGEKPDLSAVDLFSTKEEKGIFVYNRLNETARKSQENTVEILEQSKSYFQAFTVVNSMYAVFSKNELEQIASLPEVEKILPNPQITFDTPEIFSSEYKDSTDQITYGVQMIQADEVWAMGLKGAGVTVGGQDTGYDWTHPGLQNQYRGRDTLTGNVDHNYNWHDAIHEINPLSGDSIPDPSNNPCGLDSAEPCDVHNHGTHTMGTMIGSYQKQQFGVAPEANWVGCRNMERGSGAPSTYLECFDWFLAPTDLADENPDPTKSPHVINNSWYCSEREGCLNDNFEYFEEVVNNLKAAGVVVVVSAGNDGRQGCASIATQPPIYENSFSIGAVDENDNIAAFSSRGPVMIDGSNRMKPNVSAPGVRVYSTIRNENFGQSSGTSMAGPHVAGTVALMISANPNLAGNVEAIETILENTAVHRTDTTDCGGFSGMEIPNPIYGYGRINALAAVQAAMDFSSVENQNQFQNAVEVYPNPTSDVIYFKNEKGIEFEKLEIFDAKGMMVLSQPVDSNSIISADTRGFSEGIFFFNLFSKEGVSVGKFLRK